MRDQIVFFIHLEGIGEADTLERHIVAALKPMIHGFNVDRGDVVGQQHYLIGVNLVAKLVLHFLGRDQARLQEARDESARSGEGVDNVDAF